MPLSRHHHLIFDLDDTLIQSFEGYCAVHQRTARALGLPVLSLDELVAYDDDFPSTLRRQYPEADPAVFIEKWDEIAEGFPYSPITGVSEALQRLLQQGHDLWIITSRSRERLVRRMREGGLEEAWFRGVFTSEEQPAPKPDPRCFEPVWQALGQRPDAERLLYVGDRQCDREAAEAASIEFVAVQTGPEARFGFPHDLPRDWVLGSAAEVPTWLTFRS